MPNRATTEQLRTDLSRIDVEGWDGPTARTLLDYVRSHIVAPHVAATGLEGPAAAQAEATGWEVAWRSLSSRYIRTADRPWSVVWVAVRRAVRGELFAGRLVTGERSAWRYSPTGVQTPGTDVQRFAPPRSLDALMTGGHEPAARTVSTGYLGPRLEAVVQAMVRAGWQPEDARAVVDGVASTAGRGGKAAADLTGWRPLAARLGIPQWRVRRVMVLLCGAPGWPGLVERMVTNGTTVLADPTMRTAIATTVDGTLPSPARVASRAWSDLGDRVLTA